MTILYIILFLVCFFASGLSLFCAYKLLIEQGEPIGILVILCGVMFYLVSGFPLGAAIFGEPTAVANKESVVVTEDGAEYILVVKGDVRKGGGANEFRRITTARSCADIKNGEWNMWCTTGKAICMFNFSTFETIPSFNYYNFKGEELK